MKVISDFHDSLEYLVLHPKGRATDLLKIIDFDLYDNLVNRKIITEDGYKYRLTEDGFNYYVDNVYQSKKTKKCLSRIISRVRGVFN
jgi:hypothetical protein